MPTQNKISHIANQYSQVSQPSIVEFFNSQYAPKPIMVERVNWSEYPYKPKVVAQLTYDEQMLWCKFTVSEKHLLINTIEDQGPVWEDSCVEIFIATSQPGIYINFEMNAAGALVAARRTGRNDPHALSSNEMSQIIRIGSQPRIKCNERAINDNDIAWHIIIGIPFAILGYNKVPESLNINLQKCGDKTIDPHFLSFAPIATPTPDFHRPEFFTSFILE